MVPGYFSSKCQKQMCQILLKKSLAKYKIVTDFCFMLALKKKSKACYY